ncbi:beta-ketoacyl-[acyl-carrier-protein] synthase II [Mangrovactinospora gilvigrisea]|uniref:3-oxoacyl-[acyl-carrier-protein] synthase 2 n=1 Tax=Mangrovactinospora gilvigrisea TaxID=1428644 RepID=A0A1J7CAH9_9ACTN|nr:beta-ketoacyl-ACP synthase II [Mangrovactinospora gilvigrisea]OIV38520.1 beta-ketoacyl-[acyl-carrier-protein] synthase II [Mangrovactinospora gilvigrisea]
MNATSRTVVVTGLGATTPLGGDASSTWEALLAGRSGADKLPEELFGELPVRIGAPAKVEPTEVLPRVQARKLDRSAQFALIAAREAWADAGFTGPAGSVPEGASEPEAVPTRVAAVVGTGIGGVTTLLGQYDNLKNSGPRKVSPHTVPMLMPNSPAANVGLEVNAKVAAHTTVSACASGAEAIGYALDIIRAGRADVVICGGTEAAIHPLPLAAFANMMALSKRNDEPELASRPFDAGRDGFLLGEGAGILVLESAEHAARRGARVYAEIAGSGVSADSHHIAQPDPTGSGVERALRAAMEDAGMTAEDIDHVNPHATSTPLGDTAEAQALHRVLGERASAIPVSATKSMTGHTLGAAGAIEAVFTVLALHERLAPPTINLDEVDADVDLDIVVDEPRKLADGPLGALSNSFGFGGANVVLAIRTA